MSSALFLAECWQVYCELHRATGFQGNLIPLAFASWYMGCDSLLSSGLTAKLLYLFEDRTLHSPRSQFQRIRTSRMVMFVALELIGFGATMAISQTIAAIGFPVVIALLVPLRVWVIPKLSFTAEELAILDGPVASQFVRSIRSIQGC